MAAAISRRSALAVMGVGLGAVLVACDGAPAPEDNSTATPGPNLPPEATPTPSQAADSGVLLLALARAQHLAASSRAITGADGWRRSAHQQIQTSLDEQVRVLEEVLRAGGVPVPTLSPTTEPGGTTTTGPTDGDLTTASPAPSGDSVGATGSDTAGDGAATSSAPGDAVQSTGDAAENTADAAAARAVAQLRDLAQDCLQDVSTEALTGLTEVSAANLPMLIAIAGQRGATARILGADLVWEPLTGPSDAAAAELLDAYRPAVYGFEVLAARSHGDERTAYERVLSPLRQVTRQLTQLAGEAAPPAPLGYGLPEALDGQASRERLAGSLMAALPPTIMAPTKGFVGDVAAVTGSVHLLAEAVRLGRPWNPMTGFPGMQVPGD
ncbi:DUF4439 domain-containing protein [Ornithinimicrobium sp. F0845]|uniref:DUF4439 domain-containing protein n=1 Tax=Ornithinimicrobium sp. F0845 TaxID=2926412 RepID=UPI001FF68C91|nr:DUF4439 domain-containing protein [Ornithinimicrobium sp. F0845]MCK0111245.1 DUF4439 domain-containing protein [Ornithinimicrobium sp. F0845]